MLYLKKQISDSALLGIWKIEESPADLYSRLEKVCCKSFYGEAKSVTRKLEILATRVLLKELLGVEKEICHFPSGKPYLSDGAYQLSISHTKNYVAIILDKSLTMGLDIEQRTNKIFRVRDRIISQSEYIDPAQEQIHLLLHWSAKEAMFKYLNVSGVDFRNHLHVEAFSPGLEGVFNVFESRTSHRQVFNAHYLVDSEFVLVSLIEKEENFI